MNKVKFHILLSILTLLTCTYSAVAGTYSVSDLPNVQLQDRTKHLVNPDGIISPSVASQIDSLLLDARRKASVEIVAVVVDNIDTDDIDSYATKLFNTWGIGKKDKNNGILIIAAKDRRAATIRSGYGAEGVLPDILAGRIVYDRMIPRFRNGDYDGGVLEAVKEVHRLVTDPDAVAELMSKQHDNYPGMEADFTFSDYLHICVWAALILLVVLVILLVYIDRSPKITSDYQKCQFLDKWKLPFWMVTLLFIGIPIIAPLALMLLSRYYRNHPRECPRCHTKMQKLSEEEDNKYLTYAQDLEERINSVDYDVWLCPECGEKDIYSFVNKASNYQTCKSCNARTSKLTGVRIITEPTYSHGGVGERVYTCLNCGNERRQRYSIPKKERPVAVAAGTAGSILGGGRGGGGFRGGGFGGGLTGGGGATGRW